MLALPLHQQARGACMCLGLVLLSLAFAWVWMVCGMRASCLRSAALLQQPTRQAQAREREHLDQQDGARGEERMPGDGPPPLFAAHPKPGLAPEHLFTDLETRGGESIVSKQTNPSGGPSKIIYSTSQAPSRNRAICYQWQDREPISTEGSYLDTWHREATQDTRSRGQM